MPLPVPFFLKEEILPISPSAGVLPYLDKNSMQMADRSWILDLPDQLGVLSAARNKFNWSGLNSDLFSHLSCLCFSVISSKLSSSAFRMLAFPPFACHFLQGGCLSFRENQLPLSRKQISFHCQCEVIRLPLPTRVTRKSSVRPRGKQFSSFVY